MNAPIEDTKKLDTVYSHISEKLEEKDPKKSEPLKEKKARKKIFNRISIVAVCVLGFFIMIIVVPEIPQVQAFRFDVNKYFNQLFNPKEEIDENGNVTKHYSSVDQMNSDMGIELPTLNSIPEGFELIDINAQKDINNNFRTAHYNYKKDEASDDNFIDIGIIYFGNNTANSQFNSSTEFDEYTVKNIKIAISKDEPYNAHFYYYNQYLISISTSLNKNDLLKLIENIK